MAKRRIPKPWEFDVGGLPPPPLLPAPGSLPVREGAIITPGAIIGGAKPRDLLYGTGPLPGGPPSLTESLFLGLILGPKSYRRLSPMASRTFSESPNTALANLISPTTIGPLPPGLRGPLRDFSYNAQVVQQGLYPVKGNRPTYQHSRSLDDYLNAYEDWISLLMGLLPMGPGLPRR